MSNTVVTGPAASVATTDTAGPYGHERYPSSTQEIAGDAPAAAAAVGLAYVVDDQPGIRRRRRGKGFSYTAVDGSTIRDLGTLARIRSLAIPPAWTGVWICADELGHIQATGRDAEGRKQYRYHPKWGEHRSRSKYARIIAFSDALPAIRARVEADLNKKGLPREKVIATAVRLLETTFIRIGNKQYARARRSYGLTTLLDRHIKIEGSRLHFKFRGKSGQEQNVELKDRRLARIVERCRELPGQQLFQYVDDDGTRQSIGSGDVNNYLREVAGQDFSAKDFRTWGGTLLALRELSKLEPPVSARATKKAVTQAICQVSNMLGNRPATCRKYYIHPVVIDAYSDGSLAEAVNRVQSQRVENAPHDLDLEEAILKVLLRAANADSTEEIALPAAAQVARPESRRTPMTRFSGNGVKGTHV